MIRKIIEKEIKQDGKCIIEIIGFNGRDYLSEARMMEKEGLVEIEVISQNMTKVTYQVTKKRI